MEEKEPRRFSLGIELNTNNAILKPRFIVRNSNMSKDIIINQLRLFIKKLEDDYYPDFRNDITTINSDPGD